MYCVHGHVYQINNLYLCYNRCPNNVNLYQSFILPLMIMSVPNNYFRTQIVGTFC